MFSYYKLKIGEIALTKDGFKVEIVDRTTDNGVHYYICKPTESKSFYREISEKNLIKAPPRWIKTQSDTASAVVMQTILPTSTKWCGHNSAERIKNGIY